MHSGTATAAIFTGTLLILLRTVGLANAIADDDDGGGAINVPFL